MISINSPWHRKICHWQMVMTWKMKSSWEGLHNSSVVGLHNSSDYNR